MVVHDDEHTLLKAILCKALGDDAYLRSLVSTTHRSPGVSRIVACSPGSSTGWSASSRCGTRRDPA
jgi:hypothetical protein